MNPKISTQLPLAGLVESKVENLPLTEKNLPLEKMVKKAEGQKKYAFHEEEFNGLVFFELTSIKKSNSKNKFGTMWWFKCSCGKVFERLAYPVFKGYVKSCGCLRRASKHGISNTSFYKVVKCICARCKNPNNPRWSSYGGRGITIYEPWAKNPKLFLEALGPPPDENLSIDRIDNNKGYFPGNVRWADRKTQQRNTRRNHFIEFNGETKCIAEWAEYFGITPACLETRIKRKWPLERAMTGRHFKKAPCSSNV